jgi:hypothetical protein
MPAHMTSEYVPSKCHCLPAWRVRGAAAGCDQVDSPWSTATPGRPRPWDQCDPRSRKTPGSKPAARRRCPDQILTEATISPRLAAIWRPTKEVPSRYVAINAHARYDRVDLRPCSHHKSGTILGEALVDLPVVRRDETRAATTAAGATFTAASCPGWSPMA